MKCRRSGLIPELYTVFGQGRHSGRKTFNEHVQQYGCQILRWHHRGPLRKHGHWIEPLSEKIRYVNARSKIGYQVVNANLLCVHPDARADTGTIIARYEIEFYYANDVAAIRRRRQLAWRIFAVDTAQLQSAAELYLARGDIGTIMWRLCNSEEWNRVDVQRSTGDVK